MDQIQFHHEPKIENVKVILEPGANLIDVANRIIFDFGNFKSNLIAEHIIKVLKEGNN